MKDKNDPDTERQRMVSRYRHLTANVMPSFASSRPTAWPVVNDHCFQRIVLDTVCGGVWYDQIARPAYKNMTSLQAADAVALREAILDGSADLVALNRQSLHWRGKLKGANRQARPPSR